MTSPSSLYIKHLVECNCILPQYQSYKPTVFHKFVVFSVLDTDGNIVPSFAQCPNCNAVHQVLEVLTTRVLPKETLAALPSVDELKTCVPECYGNMLELYKCDVATWQEVKHILDNQLWGTQVILAKDNLEDGTISGKFVIILSEKLYKIDNYVSVSDNTTKE